MLNRTRIPDLNEEPSQSHSQLKAIYTDTNTWLFVIIRRKPSKGLILSDRTIEMEEDAREHRAKQSLDIGPIRFSAQIAWCDADQPMLLSIWPEPLKNESNYGVLQNSIIEYLNDSHCDKCLFVR